MYLVQMIQLALMDLGEFRRFYAHDDIVFYAITDGTRYEVGSGLFKNKDESAVDSYHVDTILRNPIRSSNLTIAL